MRKKNIFPTCQDGFRKGRCTSDNLVKLTAQIKKQFSKRKSTLATFFDIRKAYDSVWHDRLLYKLNEIGITGVTYQFVKNLLSDRSIQVRLGNVYSSA